MKIKSTLLIAFVLAISFELMSQSNTVSSGGEATGINGNVSYTLGQVVQSQSSSSSVTVNEGVQQPFQVVTSLSSSEFDFIELSAYPNPTYDVLNIKRSAEYEQPIQLILLNSNGQVVVSKVMKDNIDEIKLNSFAKGIYFLNAQTANESLIKSFKIIKN